MKKLILAALVVTASGAALAQTNTPPGTVNTPSGTINTPPGTVNTSPGTVNASPGTDASGSAAGPASATPPAGADQSVTMPAGGAVTVDPAQNAVSTPMTASGDVPPCSKTVTDRCMQTHEGHGGMMMHHRGKMRHHPMRHHKM